MECILHIPPNISLSHWFRSLKEVPILIIHSHPKISFATQSPTSHSFPPFTLSFHYTFVSTRRIHSKIKEIAPRPSSLPVFLYVLTNTFKYCCSTWFLFTLLLRCHFGWYLCSSCGECFPLSSFTVHSNSVDACILELFCWYIVAFLHPSEGSLLVEWDEHQAHFLQFLRSACCGRTLRGVFRVLHRFCYRALLLGTESAQTGSRSGLKPKGVRYMSCRGAIFWYAQSKCPYHCGCPKVREDVVRDM